MSPGMSGSAVQISMPMATMMASATPSSEITLRAMCHASLSPCFVRVSTKTGMNAEDNAPSPKSARNMFGMRKATTKSDIAADVPKAAAVSVSRIRPSTRLIRVNPPTLNAERMTREFSMNYDNGPQTCPFAGPLQSPIAAFCSARTK